MSVLNNARNDDVVEMKLSIRDGPCSQSCVDVLPYSGVCVLTRSCIITLSAMYSTLMELEAGKSHMGCLYVAYTMML